MALQSKSISANGAKGRQKFTLTVTENSTNISGNSSSVSWALVISRLTTYDWISSVGRVKYSVVINGKTYSGTIPTYDGTSTVTIASETETCSHNADGKKSISFSFSITDSTDWVHGPGNASASGSMTLTDIPRQATITSAPNFDDEVSSVTITYSNPAGTAVDKVEACIASANGKTIYVPYREVSRTGTSYTFAFTTSERSTLRSAATGNSLDLCYYLCTTIGGVKYYDHKSCTMTIGNANPIVTASVVDTNATTIALTGNKNILVKHFSTAKATMTAEAQKGATLDADSYVITNGRVPEYGTEGTFENVEDNTFTFAVTDSRGNTGRTTVTPTMVDYAKLTCILGNNVPDGDGKMTVTCSGIFFNGSFGAVANTLSVQYRYKAQSGAFGGWSDMTISKSGNRYYASASLSGLDYKTAYVFECRVVDKLMTVTQTSSALKSLPVFHWSETDFAFEVPVSFNGGIDGMTFNGDLDVSGDLRLKGSGNYGNTLRFGDGNYCYITEASGDVMTILAKRINLEANGVYVYGNPIPTIDKGVWTPYLNSAVVSSYTTQYGWYSKLGQTVSIGFFIKATCKSGYDSTDISISGLPYTPMFSAAGGGMCSGAFVSAGFNFQCFVAEKDSDKITTRVQSCNHTAQTNLSTSASGCWYRSGGGEITLSGTITYIADE